jgi:hypothetical protein
MLIAQAEKTITEKNGSMHSLLTKHRKFDGAQLDQRRRSCQEVPSLVEYHKE